MTKKLALNKPLADTEYYQKRKKQLEQAHLKICPSCGGCIWGNKCGDCFQLLDTKNK